MVILLILLALLVILWGREALQLRRALRALPVRIHVNGSRGKSSVTRLIAAALREGGISTFAKTTGSTARLILPDGTEEPIVRMGTPNICEQIVVLDRARASGARAMVMECMAVRPDLQKVTEEQIMHSTIGVITNIRPDHLDVMGPTIHEVARALSTTIPRKGIAVLGDARFTDSYGRAASSRRSRLLVARPEEISASDMSGFPYVEHEENVATALAVTRELAVPDDVALRGMYKVTPDVGACTRWQFRHNDRPIEFINIFAANDLESTISIWRKVGLGAGEGALSVALINMRGDRVDRSLQFVEAVETGLRADHYALIGDYPESILRQFQRKVPGGRLHACGRAAPEEIFDRVTGLGDGPIRVGGVGNIGGLGHEVLRYVVRGGNREC